MCPESYGVFVAAFLVFMLGARRKIKDQRRAGLAALVFQVYFDAVSANRAER